MACEPLFVVGRDPDGPNLTWYQSGRILPDGGAVVGGIDALAPGMNYGVAVSLHGVLYHQSEDLTAEPGETLERDIEVAGECP